MNFIDQSYIPELCREVGFEALRAIGELPKFGNDATWIKPERMARGPYCIEWTDRFTDFFNIRANNDGLPFLAAPYVWASQDLRLLPGISAYMHCFAVIGSVIEDNMPTHIEPIWIVDGTYQQFNSAIFEAVDPVVGIAPSSVAANTLSGLLGKNDLGWLWNIADEPIALHPPGHCAFERDVYHESRKKMLGM